MLERFDDRARAAVHGAGDAARTLGHNYMGTEHLLLGLLAGSGGVADLLAARGVTVGRVRAEMLEILGRGPDPQSGPDDATALAAIGIDLDEVRRRVEAAFGPGALAASSVVTTRRRRRRRRCYAGPELGRGDPPFTPRAKRCLDLALRHAGRLGSAQVTGEHVLLGVLDTPEGLAVRILERVGVERDDLRHLVLERVRSGAV
jgi:ATP-dependent Clp protease ATP-binding subunit ClpA